MRIRVDEIPESGRFLHFHWDEGRFNEFLSPDDPFEIRLARPVNVDLQIQKRPDHIRIEGNIEATLQVVCHRCLTSFLYPMEEEVDVYLIEEQTTPPEEEIELEVEELEQEFFDGEVIDVDQLIAEQIFLALPYKVLCAETCRGICPACGANLNEEECKCEKSTDESPFAALESLKRQLTE